MSSVWSKSACLLVLLALAATVCHAQENIEDVDPSQDDIVVPIVDEASVPKNPAIAGSWSEVFPAGVVPVAAALLPDGRVLAWSAWSKDDYAGVVVADGPDHHPAATATVIFDPATGESTERNVTETQHDMFCPGISYLPNGHIVVTGGQIKSETKTSIYDAVADTWVNGAELNIGRGYHSSVLLSNREMFVLGGSWSGPDDDHFVLGDREIKFGPRGGEVTVTDEATGEFTWRELPAIDSVFIRTEDREGPYRADNHLWLYAWKNASVFHAGPSKAMHWIDPTTETGSYSPAGVRPGGHAMCGTAAMYDAEKGLILTAGGAPSYTQEPAIADAALITLPMDSSSMPTIEELPPMKQARSYQSTVILPDGKVLLMGGMELPELFVDDGAFLEPEIWDPATKEFTLLAPMAVPRTYHSIALLLKDGRVVTGGGGLCGECKGEYFINHLDFEIFTPPYLYGQDGQFAERPKIAISAPSVVNGEPLRVWSNMDANMISIVRFSSATHAVNTDQRRIEMCGPNAAPCEKLPVGSCPNIGQDTGGADNGADTGPGTEGTRKLQHNRRLSQDTVGGADTGTQGGCYEVFVSDDPAVAVPGYYLVFVMNAEGVPSEGETMLIP